MTANPPPYDEQQSEFLAWLEEIADLAETDPGTEEGREEARECAFELADNVMTHLNAVERNRLEAGQGGMGKITLAGMEELEAYLSQEGFIRASVGMRVLIDRGYGEFAHKAADQAGTS